MAETKKLSLERLQEALEYDKDTGGFKWRINKRGAKKGERAGRLNRGGYVVISLDGKSHLAHRLAYFIHHEERPKHIVDHINGNRQDNRIKNLRDVTAQENSRNRKRPKNNTSGFTGVSFNERRELYTARITINGKNVLLGEFEELSEAVIARRTTEMELGYSGGHGR